MNGIPESTKEEVSASRETMSESSGQYWGQVASKMQEISKVLDYMAMLAVQLRDTDKKELEKLYEQGASYAFIAKQIGADSIKQVDNYIYKSGLSREYSRKVGQHNSGGGTCIAPVHRLRKDEIIWLSKHYCRKHGAPFITCYDCYLEENPEMNRIGAIDLECSALNASLIDFFSAFALILASYAGLRFSHRSNPVYFFAPAACLKV